MYKHTIKHVKRACKNCKFYQLKMGICCNKDSKYMLQKVDPEMMPECWIRRAGRLPLEVEAGPGYCRNSKRDCN